MELQGKSAIVTGGGTGIGLAIAIALADAGADVTITGRRRHVLEDAAGPYGLSPLVMDVTDETAVTDAFAQIGPVDICIANAGIAEGGSIVKTDADLWRRTMATNLDGAFFTFREALRQMHKSNYGRLIAVSSIAGLKGLKGAATYTASKHGMIGLMRGLAADYAGSQITSNALCPGYVDTDIVTRSVATIKARAGISDDQALNSMVSLNPHKRLIAPEEVADAALWLCNPASGSINGQAIEIAGGQV